MDGSVRFDLRVNTHLKHGSRSPLYDVGHTLKVLDVEIATAARI